MVKIEENIVNVDIDDPLLRLETDIIHHQKLTLDWEWNHDKSQSTWGPTLLVWLVSGGRGELWADGTRYEVRRGCFFSCPPGAAATGEDTEKMILLN